MSRKKIERVSYRQHKDSMFEIVSEHMAEFFPESNVEILPKNSGDQLGCIARVYWDELNQDYFQYFIKTFSNGSYDKNNYQYANPYAKPDLRELFVYYALENMGFGPKSFCLFRPSKIDPEQDEYYIVTEDLATTKCQDKEKRYTMFNEVNLPSRTSTLLNLLCLDLLIKTFRLGDIHNDNFGQMLVNDFNDLKEKWHIHDFSVPRHNTTETSFERLLCIEDGIIDVRPGTYPCFYRFMNQKRISSINHYDLLLFIQQSVTIFDNGRASTVHGNKLGFLQALEQAYQSVVDFFGEDDPDLEALQEYYADVTNKFMLLEDLIYADIAELAENTETAFNPM